MEAAERGGWLVGPAAAGEAPALAALGAEALARGWSVRSVAEELARSDVRVFVLREAPAGPPAGFLLARRVLEALHVMLVAVAPALRRRGGGSALVRALLEEARAERLAGVELEVRASNVPALALYARHGFLAVGRRPRYYEGREDAVLMTLELAAETIP